jgi:hypothetical protein
METVLLQINNNKAYQLLKDLEDLNIVKVLKKSVSIDKKKSAHDFLGLISKTDVDLIDKAIEDDCENIDLDGWK